MASMQGDYPKCVGTDLTKMCEETVGTQKEMPSLEEPLFLQFYITSLLLLIFLLENLSFI